MEKIKILSGLLLGISLAAAPAFAQPASGARGGSIAEAQEHFKRGAELYDEDNFRGALIEFQRAYELAPSYKILFNIGQVEMELQNYAGALRAYQRYLREGGPDVPAGRVTQVTQEIDRLKGRVGELVIETVQGAEILIDEISVGFAPLPEPAAVNTGRHRIAVHVPGKDPMTRVVDVAGLQRLTVVLGDSSGAVAGKPSLSVTNPAPNESGPPSKVPMYVAWSATGALAVGAGVFSVLAYSASTDLDDLRNKYPVTREELADKADEQKRLSLIADAFIAATLVAGGVSLYLTFTRDTGAEKPSKLGLKVSPTGAYVTGSF